MGKARLFSEEGEIEGKLDPAAPRGHTESYRGILRNWTEQEVRSWSSSCLYGHFQETLDVRLNVDGLKGAAVASEGLPLWSYEELLEVPGHV